MDLVLQKNHLFILLLLFLQIVAFSQQDLIMELSEITLNVSFKKTTNIRRIRYKDIFEMKQIVK